MPPVTEATPVALLDQVPPVVPVEVRVMDDVAQTADGPLIAPALGTGFTVTDLNAVSVPQELTTI
jgi:hypothetical protein